MTFVVYTLKPVPSSGSFGQGRVGVVTLNTDKFLGSLRRINIAHDNSGLLPSWYLDKVVVTRREGNDRSTVKL